MWLVTHLLGNFCLAEFFLSVDAVGGEKKEECCSSIIKWLIMEENTVFCNNIDLQWLNHPAETRDIFPVSFSGGFLTLISKLDLMIPFFSPCKLNLSPGRFTMVRKQDTQLGEEVGLCSCCIVHFNKAHRLFSLFLQQRRLFSFLFFFWERERVYSDLVLSVADLPYLSRTFSSSHFFKTLLFTYARVNTNASISMLGNCTSVTVRWDS